MVTLSYLDIAIVAFGWIASGAIVIGARALIRKWIS